MGKEDIPEGWVERATGESIPFDNSYEIPTLEQFVKEGRSSKQGKGKTAKSKTPTSVQEIFGTVNGGDGLA